MKKVLLISALLLAMASTVCAQTPRLPDPQQQSMIRNAQSSYMKSTNDKNKPHLKLTDFNRVAQQGEQDMKTLHEQESLNLAMASAPQIRKQNDKDYSKRYKKSKRMRDKAKRDKVERKRLNNLDNRKTAERKAAQAQNQKDDAIRALTQLLDKQKKEMTELQERHAREAAAGLTEEMSQRHERELQELNTEHARQLMDAQKAVDEASRNYEKALEILDKARRAANATN